MNRIKITFAPRYSGRAVQSRGYVAYSANNVYLTRRQHNALMRRCRAIGGDYLLACDDGRELDVVKNAETGKEEF